jgi:hypothetical protein
MSEPADDTLATLRQALCDAAHALSIAVDAPAYIIRYDDLVPAMIVSVMPCDEAGCPDDDGLIELLCAQFGMEPADAAQRLFRFGADLSLTPEIFTRH